MPRPAWTVLLPGFIVAGVGIGMVNPVLASSAISVVPPERSGMASGANSTFRQVGIATGIAGLGTVFQSQIEQRTLSALGTSPAGQAVVAHGGSNLQAAIVGGGVRQAPPQLPSAASRDALLHAYRVGFSATINHLMVIGAVIALIGSVGAFALVRQRDFVPSVAPEARRGPRPTARRGGRPVTAATEPTTAPDVGRPPGCVGDGRDERAS